jgi:probable HAF family extracellular repeat protein
MRNTAVVLAACVLLTASAWVGPANAQSIQDGAVNHYKLYEVEAFGSPLTIFYEYDLASGYFSPYPMNRQGDLAGIYLNKTNNAASFVWSNGKAVRLPSLHHADDGGGGSNALGIDNSGLVIGISNDGTVSPFNHQLYNHAVIWQNEKIQRLPDLGGHDSNTNSVNNSGLIVGYAYNTTSDPYSYYGTQFHATSWQRGKLSDLGTLGGTDSEAWLVNDGGQIIGISFLNTLPEPPFNQPQNDAFLWSDGTMTDLGTLGGAFSTPTSINSKGQVSVISLDATNTYFQSYVWSNGAKTVLNSVGGNYLEALRLNDAGTSIGWNSDSTDADALATVWSAQGTGQLLGTIGTDTGSIAFGINKNGVIVGGSGTIPLTGQANYRHAFVWQNGQMRDLNTLIPADSSLTLNVAYDIRDDGVIAGLGTDQAGNTHAFLLQPDGRAEAQPMVSVPAAPGRSIRTPSPLEQTLRAAHALSQAK